MFNEKICSIKNNILLKFSLFHYFQKTLPEFIKHCPSCMRLLQGVARPKILKFRMSLSIILGNVKKSDSDVKKSIWRLRWFSLNKFVYRHTDKRNLRSTNFRNFKNYKFLFLSHKNTQKIFGFEI